MSLQQQKHNTTMDDGLQRRRRRSRRTISSRTKWIARTIMIGLFFCLSLTLLIHHEAVGNNSNGTSNALTSLQATATKKNVKLSPPTSSLFNDVVIEEHAEEEEIYYASKVFPGPISSRPTTASNNNAQTSLLLDAAVEELLPQLYPARFQSCSTTMTGKAISSTNKPHDFETVYAVAEWDHPTRRLYGDGNGGGDNVDRAAVIGSSNKSNLQNLTTVIGTWPDAITSLSYIPILKNAHTSLSRVFRQLRYKIQDANVTVFNKQNRRRFYTNRRINNKTLYLTVLRDPIDRFISATCQDLRDGKDRVPIHKCFTNNNNRRQQQHHRTNTTTDDDRTMTLLETMRCLVDFINDGKLTHHQRHQHCQLRDVMMGLDEPVNVVPFDRLDDLYRELGAAAAIDDGINNNKIRDRHDPKYVTGVGRGRGHTENHGTRHSSGSRYADHVASFCSRGMDFLRSQSTSDWIDVRNGICMAYRYDVHVMRSVGMDIPLCPK